MDKLVERDQEVQTLTRVYNECSRGRSRIVALGGSLASGKTALLASFARHAADAGAKVLEATASRVERHQPLGVIDQLLRARHLFSHGAAPEVRSPADGAGGTPAHSEIRPSVLGMLHDAFQRLTAGPPLVVCIDDAHFSDVESLQYLLALVRRMGDAPMTIVLSYCPDVGRGDVQRIVQAEILRLPNCTRLDIEPLSTTGVATVLKDRLDPGTADRIASECRRLSGGRPLLVRALAEDYGRGAAEPDARCRPVPGPAFGRAVLNCLYRAEPVVLGIAQATAVLGDFRSTAVVARLCGMDPESLGRVVATPGVGALLDHDLLRQPSVRAAVLRSIPEAERHALRSRAARLLHHEGAPAVVTAEHLMRVDEAIPWAGRVLCEAADQTLASGDHETAVGYLERAHRGSMSRLEQLDTAAKLVDIVWRYDPAAAKSYLPDLVAAAERGELSLRQSVPVVRSLLWNGQVEPAMRLMAHLCGDSPGTAGEDSDRYAEPLRLWLPLAYPGIAPAPDALDVSPMDPGLDPEHRAGAALGAVLRCTGEEDALPAAELVLRKALAGAAGPASSLASLLVLIYSDHLDKASAWCDALLASIGKAYGLVWNALLISARAEIHYRLGELADAKRQAKAAFALMPRESWGTAVVIPLSLLILTTTAMGDLAESETYLDLPVPGAAFGTLGGVVYLDARGHLHLARGRHGAALQDFLAAGHLMRLWGADCPSTVAWRVDAARAYLHQGLTAKATELLTEQLSLVASGHPRTRGLAQRALAATLRTNERPPVLLKAASALDRCGDSLNLAHTLADLKHAYMSLEDPVQARFHGHRAKTLAARCAAAPLPETPVTDPGKARADENPSGTAEPVRRLSSAEWRVAELAAGGSTNEQIARKLFITVSTVEQHLTRSYRKLGIRRRTQLPSRLSELVP
ncbi:AAA family ATPase [Streptomyces sp. NPDC089799]|uniref:helix-turn-helix transcriptional regulator n=1 Tax=Streptomyces sp. NPDC089799 TaxID=3155066 RepID=UPI0034274D51